MSKLCELSFDTFFLLPHPLEEKYLEQGIFNTILKELITAAISQEDNPEAIEVVHRNIQKLSFWIGRPDEFQAMISIARANRQREYEIKNKKKCSFLTAIDVTKLTDQHYCQEVSEHLDALTGVSEDFKEDFAQALFGRPVLEQLSKEVEDLKVNYFLQDIDFIKVRADVSYRQKLINQLMEFDEITEKTRKELIKGLTDADRRIEKRIKHA